MATVQEFVQQLNDLSAQAAKIKGESQITLQKVSDLEQKLNDSTGTVDPAILDAFAALKQQVQGVDDLIPDAPQMSDPNAGDAGNTNGAETAAGVAGAGDPGVSDVTDQGAAAAQ